MTTAEHLNNLTDRSKFEVIANAYLRERFPLLANLIANGINQKGETVKGKPDAFTKIGDNHFVLVEHTTNDSNLEKKWLFDRNKYDGKKGRSSVANGDLLDAIEQALIIRKVIPKADFTIYLTTNSVVKSELFLKAVATGQAVGINVEIVELSAITHFLDNDPSGQYLRKVHLHIDQELLSSELFLEIQQKNIEQYRRDSFIDPATIIDHWQLNDFNELVQSSDKLVTFLVADSGMGKTTLAYSKLKKHLDQNERLLWTTPETIIQSSDPIQLVEQTIKRMHDKVFFNDESRKFLTSQRIYIVVDDINKSDNPLAALKKLISWGVGSDNEDYNQFKFLCPIWPRVFYEFTELEKNDDSFNYFLLEKPSSINSRMLVEKGLEAVNANFTAAEVNSLCEMNGDDPLLMGLNIQLVKKEGSYVANQSNQVIGDFVTKKMSDACRQMAIPKFKQNSLLKLFGQAMIINMKIHPNYGNIQIWFKDNPDVIKLIDNLAIEQELFLIKDDGALQFRHDRIRNYIIAEGFKIILENVQENISLISEPFFAEMLSLALVENTTNDIDLKQIIEVNPEAVFNMLKYLQSETESSNFESVLMVIDYWKNSPMFPSYNREMMDGINWTLLYTDTKEITRIAHQLPNERILNLALLRNGNAAGGINFLLTFSDFEPFWGNNLRDVIFLHAKARHLTQLESHLLQLIKANKAAHPHVKAGIFLLTGYIKVTGIAIDLKQLWEADKHPDVFIYYLWAMINCGNEDELPYLKECFDHYQTLPDDNEKSEPYGKKSKSKIAYWFSKCRWNLKDDQVQLFDSLYDEFPHLISSFFGKIDHPLAMRRTVFAAGDKTNRKSGTDYFGYHRQERWDYKENKYRLSVRTLDLLISIWQDKSLIDGIRKVAYRYWGHNDTINRVITLSRNIDEHDAILFETTITRRVELKDRTAANQFFPIIRRKRHYLAMLKYIWGDDCKIFYNRFLKEKAHRFGNEEFSLDYVNFITDLPFPEAEDILKTNWNILKQDGFTIQSALYIATPDLLRLVEEVVINHLNPKELFKYIDFTYHFIDANNYGISFEQLLALEPYLKFMEETTLRWMSEYCLKAGYKEWAFRKIHELLTPEDKVYLKPGIKDLVLEMQHFKQGDSRFMASNLLDNFKRRAIDKKTALQVFDQFSLMDKSPEAFKLLASCLAITGDRIDLKLLENYADSDLSNLKKQHIIESTGYAIRKRAAF